MKTISLKAFLAGEAERTGLTLRSIYSRYYHERPPLKLVRKNARVIEVESGQPFVWRGEPRLGEVRFKDFCEMVASKEGVSAVAVATRVWRGKLKVQRRRVNSAVIFVRCTVKSNDQR